jgi:hypothetical protein
LSIKSHGGDLLDLALELAGLLGGGKPRKYDMFRVERTYWLIRKPNSLDPSFAVNLSTGMDEQK